MERIKKYEDKKIYYYGTGNSGCRKYDCMLRQK